ncbi:MAG: GTPase HflX, partial [Pseudomonadota bacterium]
MSDDATSTEAPATRAAVLVPVLTRQARRDGETVHSPEERVTEVAGLAEAIDLDVQTADVVRVPNARPATLFGTGKVDEIAASVQAGEIGLVVVDHPITPIQQRNLELAWKTKVLDRTGLILEIFGRRAETREGRLQVELAHLTYQRGRLVRSWTHLERQRGGFGFLGGPGETQIETDRRLIQERITRIRGELETVVKTRALHRSGRAKVPYPVVALVGYTNAGKSTLFNTLTGADVFAKDQVFATLDPTMRELALPSGRRVILSDTVGFISNLPTMLVAAFRATLEEVVNADVILHVRDIAHAETDAQKSDVVDVLVDLGLDPHHADAPIIEVLNKSDRLSADDRVVLDERLARTDATAVLVSALAGDGLDALLSLIDDRVSADTIERTVSLRPEDGALMSWIFEHAHVVTRETDEMGATTLQLRLDPQRAAQLDA